MEAKEYLKRIRKIDNLIKNKFAEKTLWQGVALGTTTTAESEAVQSSGSKQIMADAVVRYTDIEKEINELEAERQSIIKTIEALPVAEYDLLHKHYVQGMPFKVIAIFNSKTYSWATTKHGRALKSVQEILDKRSCEKV